MKVSTELGSIRPFAFDSPDRGIAASGDAFRELGDDVAALCEPGAAPLRVSITGVGAASPWRCEADALELAAGAAALPSIFRFRPRSCERAHAFNAVMLVPTGIDCAIGGHAGDATPAARLLASVCDHLVIHPNVVNASDINEQSDNCLYVEGSVICRLLMGAVALRKVRRNRLFVVTEAREDAEWPVDQVVNSASAARATLGASVVEVAVLSRPLSMRMERSASGRATGAIDGLEELFAILRAARARYDAVALSTRITAMQNTADMLQQYFRGEGPNPWGGVEAALTHAVSHVLDVPSAHAPTLEEMALRLQDFGQTDPRKAAEAISMSFMFCTLKGLHRAPAIVSGHDGSFDPSLISAEDLSALVIPDGVVGLPTLAALAQGIPVIAVRGNTNLLQNDLSSLPFAEGQLLYVESYLEAAGVLSALRAGIDPASVRRPLARTRVTRR